MIFTDHMENPLCNNCGTHGHSYKECRYPVLSYGHILFRCSDMNDIKEPQILMVQRKDSLCYIEFIRGKYDVYNLSYIQILVNKFNREEKEKVVSYSFDELWKKLWMLDEIDLDSLRFRSDYIKGKDKYEKLLKGITYKTTGIHMNLNDIVEGTTTDYSESEWEFPKGRRNSGETNKECASREFGEETNYEVSDYELFDNMAPFDEEYMGENHVRYKHVYYIGYLTNLEKDAVLDPANPDQITEIKNLTWFTKSESLDILRDYHHTRRTVIHKIFKFISELNHNYFIVK